MIKNILQALSWRTLEDQLSQTVARFPVSVALLGALAVTLIIFTENSDIITETVVIKTILYSLFALWLSVAVQLGWESWGGSTKGRWALYSVVVALTLVYGASLPGSVDNWAFETVITQVIVHGALIMSLFAGLVVGPLLRREYEDDSFFNYLISTMLLMLQGFIVTGVLFALGSALLGTVDALFDVSWIESERYLQWFIISAVLVGPLFVLAQFPKTMFLSLGSSQKFLDFLVRYIAMPFIVMYMIILYAYAAKVLMSFGAWPQGEVAWLVIWFSVFAYVVFVLSYDLRSETWIARIRSWLPALLLPQLGMLFYAIGLRINQYDWTVNRYLVVAFGIWLVVVSLYYVWRRGKGVLVAIPASLFVGMCIITVGPWSMFAVSERAQIERLESIYQVDEPLSEEQEGEVYSIIHYLCEYHGCKAVYQVDAVSQALNERYDNAWDITQVLEVEPYYLGETPIGRDNYRFFEYDSYDVAGYSSLVMFDSYEPDNAIYYDEDEQMLMIDGKGLDINGRIYTMLEELESNETPAPIDFQFAGESYRMYITRVMDGDGEYGGVGGVIAY